MGWFSYELGRQDGIQEERRRNDGGCAFCWLVVMAIVVPLALVGGCWKAWKDYFHVDPPLIAVVAFAAAILIVEALIFVDAYQTGKGRAGPGSNRTLRVIVFVFSAGATLGYILLAGLAKSGHGVNSHPPVIHPAKHERIVKPEHRHASDADDTGQG